MQVNRFNNIPRQPLFKGAPNLNKSPVKAPEPVEEEKKVEEPVVPKTKAQLAMERIEAMTKNHNANKAGQEERTRVLSAKLKKVE